MYITINTQTTGKFKKKKIAGRNHLVTTMMPIRGNTAMNRILYPDDEIQKSFTQFNNMLTPNGHPKINGHSVSAFHPMAINSRNLGGFTQNPKKKGKEVFVDFVLDIEVANNTDDGKELIRRIENGEKVGVSTGLTINQLTPKMGKDDFGKDYDSVGEGFNFDHIAILLNETAAGEHAGTELILNSELKEDVTVIELNKMTVTNELSAHEIRAQLEDIIRSESPSNGYVWVETIYPDSRRFIFTIESNGEPLQFFQQTYAIDDSDTISLLADRKEVKKEVSFIEVNNNEVEEMDKEKLILALITNGFTIKTKDELMDLSESALAALLVTPVTVNAEQAKEVLVKDGFDFEAFQTFQENKEAFETFQSAQKSKLDDLRNDIVSNSDYTIEMLNGKDEVELELLKSMSVKQAKPTPRIAGGTSVVTNSDKSEVKTNYNF